MSTYYLYGAYYDKRPDTPTIRITTYIEKEEETEEWSILNSFLCQKDLESWHERRKYVDL